MSAENLVASDVWLSELIELHADEIESRGLLVHRELDAGFRMGRTSTLGAALDGLFRFVLSTVPDGCEIFVASARSEAPVARLGAGLLTLRWQVIGSDRPRPDGPVTPIRPLVGGAAAHVASKAARQLVRAFEGLGVRAEFLAGRDDAEIWARVRID